MSPKVVFEKEQLMSMGMAKVGVGFEGVQFSLTISSIRGNQ